MDIPVLIEKVGTNGFQAKMGEPLSLMAVGATREEALKNLEFLVQSRISGGAEITSLPVGTNPLARFAGMFKDNPLLEEWKQAMEEYRQKADQEEGLP
jgi:hypothetical protein